MAEKLEWEVLRRHEGDRWYDEGDVRVGTREELGHLSPKTLRAITAAKSEPSDLDKAAPANTADKAKAGRKAK